MIRSRRYLWRSVAHASTYGDTAVGTPAVRDHHVTIVGLGARPVVIAVAVIRAYTDPARADVDFLCACHTR